MRTWSQLGIAVAIPIHVVVVWLAADALEAPERIRARISPTEPAVPHVPFEVQLVVLPPEPAQTSNPARASPDERPVRARVVAASAKSAPPIHARTEDGVETSAEPAQPIHARTEDGVATSAEPAQPIHARTEVGVETSAEPAQPIHARTAEPAHLRTVVGAEPARASAPPAPVSLALPSRWDALDHPPAGRAAPPAAPTPSTTGLLGPTGTRFHSRAFDIDVAPDGSAKIRDNRNFRFGLEGRRAASERPPTHDEDIERPILNPVRPIGGTIATFDVSDWAMRSRGIDPYASHKLAILDATRDERARIGARHRRDQLARTPALVRRSLAELATLPVAAQKRALFELWDDCAETGPAELVAAGAVARAAIVEHIRAQLPAGSARAFTDDELAAFAKQQRSRASFAPY